MDTPTNPRPPGPYDHLPPAEAVRQAWIDAHTDVHAYVYGVYPELFRTLDRLWVEGVELWAGGAEE